MTRTLSFITKSVQHQACLLVCPCCDWLLARAKAPGPGKPVLARLWLLSELPAPSCIAERWGACGTTGPSQVFSRHLYSTGVPVVLHALAQVFACIALSRPALVQPPCEHRTGDWAAACAACGSCWGQRCATGECPTRALIASPPSRATRTITRARVLSLLATTPGSVRMYSFALSRALLCVQPLLQVAAGISNCCLRESLLRRPLPGHRGEAAQVHGPRPDGLHGVHFWL